MRLTRAFYGLASGKPPLVRPFVPAEHGLKEDFVLTNYTKMKG